MQRLSVLWVSLFIVGFSFSLFGQDDTPSLKIVELNQNDGLLAIPSQVVLSPGDSLQFVAANGNFAVFIENAVTFLKIKEANLNFNINSSGEQTESSIYIVREVDEDVERNYSIYCISNDTWPAAPPRIIIVVE